jgi:glucose-1-phosphate cytidylyltransferase
MKVVLFCGGLGMRLRDYDENVPKPMVPIGYRPILWHVMKYYAHFGHKDFILCLGHRADLIKSYFRNYDECVSNDFVLSEGGRRLELLQSDVSDWRITFVDTGISSNIGQRLKAVEPHLAGDGEFFANYSDGLTDLPLPAPLEHFRRHDRIASFLCVRPQLSYHFVVAEKDGQVTSIQDVGQTGLRINGGFFILRTEIFAENQLLAYRHDGFWESMDTFRDKQRLDDMHARGDAPWEVWTRAAARDAAEAVDARLPIRLTRTRRRALRSE